MPRRRPGRLARAARLLWLAWQTDRQAPAAAAWARLRGKRVRARNRLLGAASRHPLYHDLWSACRPLPAAPPAGAHRLVVLVAGAEADPAACARTCASAAVALGGAGRCLAQEQDLAAQLHALAAAEPDALLLPVRAGDLIARDAAAIAAAATGAIAYADEDRIGADLRCRAPWFKPGWDRLRFHYQDYLSGACLVRLGALADFRPGESLPDWLARAVLAPRGAVPQRLAGILVHRAGEPDPAVAARGHAARIAPLLPPGARAAAGEHGLAAIDWPLPDPPPAVSVIVPTRDGADLLAACLAGLDRTAYPGRIELIVVDNGSTDPAALALLADRAARGDAVLRIDAPFNFAALNAAGAARATGDCLCLLNNDIELPDPDWLARMVALAVRPGTGAVGIQLRYPDGTIQHAGVVAGLGDAAGHILRGQDAAAPLHHALAQVTRETSIVTAACLVVMRAAWDAVGGMDAAAFPVAFNDVDLCLRLAAAGYRNAYLGDRAAIHHESKSRGSDMAAARIPAFRAELAALQRRWNTAAIADPYYHPLLTRRSEDHFAELDAA